LSIELPRSIEIGAGTGATGFIGIKTRVAGNRIPARVPYYSSNFIQENYSASFTRFVGYVLLNISLPVVLAVIFVYH
jgi:hypothetical protein